MTAIQGVTILFRANSHVILTLPCIWGMSGREELCRCFGCARWVCMGVRCGWCGAGRARCGCAVRARWGRVVRVPYEDSPYRPRNLL